MQAIPDETAGLLYTCEHGVSTAVDRTEELAARKPQEPQYELQVIYEERFSAHVAYRLRVWSVLVAEFFSGLIPRDAALLDLGCGYGEFVNNVQCRMRYGMDLNSRTRKYLDRNVLFLHQDCSTPWGLDEHTLDVVFTSNFFEHLPSKDALRQTLAEAWRCLKPGGCLIAMGPNIRFVGGAYWDFWDHYLALTECSLAEALRILGFQIEKRIDRFLPYTMVNKRAIPSALISLYLKVPFLWKVLGKQFLIVARKPC